MWKTFTEGNAFAQATDILAQMNTQAASLFPQDFADFKTSASAYTLRGILLQDLIQLESMFLQLDENNDVCSALKSIRGCLEHSRPWMQQLWHSRTFSQVRQDDCRPKLFKELWMSSITEVCRMQLLHLVSC
jgi:hypothetical protein